MPGSFSDVLAQWIWIGPVLIGISLFFTAYYFRHQSKKLSSSLSSLYKLNQKCHQDALDFFNDAWPILEKSGCVEMQASIEWFGEKNFIKKGKSSTKGLVKQSFNVVRDDMRFDILLFITRDAAQQESLFELVTTTFLNILEQNLVLKQAEILTSQKRLERYQLFVQHEIKNIAQFIQLLSEQVQTVKEDEAKVMLVNRLSTTIPVMEQRARKTIEHMQQPLSEFYEGHVISINEIVRSIVDMYGLQAYIEGDVSTNLPRQVLTEVFKNILGNFRDHPSSEKPLQISVMQSLHEQTIQINIISEKLDSKELQAERMFEPFWTTSESGMGLGLFLSRELLKQLDGEIKFHQGTEDNEFGFLIEIPCMSS